MRPKPKPHTKEGKLCFRVGAHRAASKTHRLRP
jgi:hypothetical protein